MTLMDQVNNDIKEAMKAKQAERLSALRMLKAEYIKNKTDPKPVDELSVTISYAKRLKDSLSLYQEGCEAYEKISREIEFIKPYLPSQMEEAEVVQLISEIKDKGAKDMGAVMKELRPKILGRFDGKRASQLVKEGLS